jgi:diacylglycerol kinase
VKQSVPSRGVSSRINSFRYALHGITILLRSQVNARIHLLATFMVLAAGISLQLAANDWVLVALAISGVWVAEALNTAIEFLVDLVSPEMHPLAGKVKDVAAGAVLIAAVAAAVVGLLVFVPPVQRLIGHLAK